MSSLGSRNNSTLPLKTQLKSAENRPIEDSENLKMSRNVKTNLVASISAFGTVQNLIEQALVSIKSNKQKVLTENREKILEIYMKLDTQWQLYKSDVIEKEKISAEIFDSMDGSYKPKYEMKSEWSKSQMETFADLIRQDR